MKRTIILVAFAAAMAVTMTGGTHAKALSPSQERLLTCLMLELAEKGRCADQQPTLISGYVADQSTSPDEVLGGRKARPVARSLLH